MSLNTITIMGRLTYDPELRRTQTGTAVTSFTLAVEQDYKPDGGERETDFIDCVAFRTTAEFVEKYFSKGRMAVVTGRLRIRTWTDKDGKKRKSAEVNAEHVYFGDAKPKTDNTQAAGGTFGGYSIPEMAPTPDFALLDDDDSLPF